MTRDPLLTPWLPSDDDADRRKREALRALDAFLHEAARQGAVVLPRYCNYCGAMDHPPRPGKPCRGCGLE